MKVKLCDTMVYLDIENPTNLTEKDKQLLKETIEERKLRCAGCDKELNDNWIATIHRPKSAYHEETGKSSHDWSIWFLHHGNRECPEKWLKKRKN